MLGNRKGIVGIDDAIVICAIVLAGAAAIWLADATSKSIHDVFGGNKNQAKQVYKLEETRTPFYQDATGKFVPGVKQDSRKEYRENVLQTEPPLTWFQKYGWILIILVVLAIAFPAVTISVWSKAKSNLSQIVTGIEQAKTQLPPASVAILENNLSKKMDTNAKKVVKKARAAIKAEDLTPPSTPPVAPPLQP